MTLGVHKIYRLGPVLANSAVLRKKGHRQCVFIMSKHIFAKFGATTSNVTKAILKNQTL